MANEPETDPQRQELLDEEFRLAMRENQHPQAEKWVQLDNKAQGLEEQVIDGVRDFETRRGGIGPAHLALEEARLDRDEHRQNPPGHDYEGGKKKWDQDYKELDEEVARRDKAFGEALKNATPSELAKLQEDIDQKRDALLQTIEARQGIARLPSERSQEDQQSHGRNQQGQASLVEQDASVEQMVQREAQQGKIYQEERQQVPAQDREPTQQQDQDQQQGPEIDPYVVPQGGFKDRLAQMRDQEGQQDTQSQGAVAGRRLQPNFAAYATTMDDLNETRQLEQDQWTLTQQLGHRPTHDQVVSFERERAEAQAAASGQTQANGVQQDQGSDLHAQVFQATGVSMADRVAARRGQVAEASQGEGSNIKQSDTAGQVDDAKPVAKQATEENRGASTVAEREAKQTEQASAKSEAKADQTQVKASTRDYTDEQGMGM